MSFNMPKEAYDGRLFFSVCVSDRGVSDQYFIAPTLLPSVEGIDFVNFGTTTACSAAKVATSVISH